MISLVAKSILNELKIYPSREDIDESIPRVICQLFKGSDGMYRLIIREKNSELNIKTLSSVLFLSDTVILRYCDVEQIHEKMGFLGHHMMPFELANDYENKITCYFDMNVPDYPIVRFVSADQKIGYTIQMKELMEYLKKNQSFAHYFTNN